MNNKGFTLVEIIAVISLLALLSVVIIVNMNGVQESNNENEIKKFKDRITSAGCQYIDKGSNLKLSTNSNCSVNSSLTTREGCKALSDGCYVCLNTLVQEGLIDKSEIDPTNNKVLKDELTSIRVKVKWVYEGSYKKKKCTFESS